MVQSDHEKYLERIANPPLPAHQAIRALARVLSGRPGERDEGTSTVDRSVLSDLQGFQGGQ